MATSRVEELALALHRAPDVDSLAELVVSEVRDRFGPAACSVAVREDQRLVPRRWYGIEKGAELHSIRLDGAVADRLSSGVPLHVADLRADVIRDMGGRMAQPCLGRSSLQAAIVVDEQDSEVELRSFLGRIGPHVGLALESLGNLPQARSVTVAVDPGRVLSLTKSFGHPGTLYTTASRVVSAAVDALLASRGMLFLHDTTTDELCLVGAIGLLDKGLEHRVNGGSLGGLRFPRSGTSAGDVVLTGLSRLVYAEQLSEETGQPWWPDTTMSGVFALLPLALEHQVIGVVVVNRERASSRLESADDILGDLLERGAIAMSRAQLNEPLTIDVETGLYKGQFVESLLDDAVQRADHSESRLTVVSLRVGESSTHRGDQVQPPPVMEVADALRQAAEQDLDLVGHLEHGRFVAILEDTGAEVAHTLIQTFLESVAEHRTEVSVHAAAVVERRLGEGGASVWTRAHELLSRIYDEGPGLRIGVATQVRERVVRQHVPDFVTPMDPERR